MDDKARALLQKLGIDYAKPAVVPLGEWTGGGFTGPVLAAHLHSAGAEGEMRDPPGSVAIVPMGNWGFRYYFRDKTIADAFSKEHGNGFGSTPVWRAAMATQNVIASPETVSRLLGEGDSKGFGDTISGEVRVASLSSRKYRHEWNLIGLPCLVAAAATAMGYDNPGFDITDLLDRNGVFTDQTFSHLCGHPDATKGDDQYYTNSLYWKQRVALWKALGEDDPVRSRPKVEENPKYSTSSDALDACLGFALGEWSSPIYCTLRLAADPRVDAISNNDNRLNLGVITALFASEAAAREAVEDGTEPVAQSSANGPAVPAAYASAGIDAGTFAAEIRRTSGKTALLAARELEITADELTAWRQHLSV